jgi:hypothetical protein
MIWPWVALGIVVVAAVILVIVVLGTARRIPELRRAAAAAQDQPAATVLRSGIAGLQDEVEHLRGRMGTTQERVAAIKGSKPDSGYATGVVRPAP